MKNIVILGAGTAGSLMANKLYKAINKKEWQITVVDQEQTHYYQPGLLFIPFGIYKPEDIVKPIKKFIPKGVQYIQDEIVKVDPQSNEVYLKKHEVIKYDVLLIATGARLAPEETPGLLDSLWRKDIFDFYTLDGAIALANKLKEFNGGKLVMTFVDMPFKCPVAPLEFVFLADAYFTKKGIREKVQITYVTPMSGVFTKPIATKKLNDLLKAKNIEVISDFYIERIDNETKKIISYDQREVPFDLLTIVPLNKGAQFVEESGLGDELGFIPVNKQTLQMEKHKNIFVLGDAAAIPTSKAGSVAHFAGEFVFENILAFIEGKEPHAFFDGHANCFIETGFGKATLIDFNYTTEPLPGTYPIPSIGPMKLLKVTRLNHWGKLMFKWIYWNFLVKGRNLPVTAHMSMAGKTIEN